MAGTCTNINKGCHLMTIRLIPTTPTTHPNFPRIIPGNRDLLNHILPPNMFRTILLSPITTRLMVPLLTAFLLHSVDQNLHLHLLPLPLPLHPHLPPRHSAYMRLPRNHNPTRRCGGPRGLLKPQTHLLSTSANRGRKKSPLLGIPRR